MGDINAIAPPRVVAVDRLRGLIIALMALDHANAFWSGGPRVGEFWAVSFPEYTQWLPAVIRWVSHLCAPGFFVLMGVSITLAASAMRSRGDSEETITRWFVKRGAVLIVVQHLVVNPAWLVGGSNTANAPGVPGMTLLYFGVLWGLGASMVALAWLRRLPNGALVAIGTAVIVTAPLLVPDPERGSEGFAWLVRLGWVPGQSGALMVRYPVLPWLGLPLLGAALGRGLARSPDSAASAWRLGSLGLALLGAFVVVRTAGEWGSTHAWDGSAIEFLNVTKYPPSVAFITLTLGVNALLLAAFHRLAGLDRVLLPLGRSSLFVYVVHLYLFGIIGRALPDTGYPLLLPLWVAGVLTLIPLCQRWTAFKRGTDRDSMWRLF